MRGEEMSGKKKGTISNLFEKMMEGLGKRELIISLFIMLAAILAIIVLIVLKLGSLDNAFNEVSWEKTTAEGEVQDAAGENMPVVETATEGTKAESTPDTTVLAKKDGAKAGTKTA